MTKKNILDRVYLKNPCSTEWSLMEGDEQIRFCSECNKHVYNLSLMTKKEAEGLLAKAGGELCAKFDRDGSGKILTADQLKHSSLFSMRLPRFASSAVAMLLGLGITAQAEVPSQSNRLVPVCLAPPLKKSAGETEIQDGKSALVGTVFDVTK